MLACVRGHSLTQRPDFQSLGLRGRLAWLRRHRLESCRGLGAGHVKTIDRVAAEPGETVNRIFDLAIDMEIEDDVIWVYGLGDDSGIAFGSL